MVNKIAQIIEWYAGLPRDFHDVTALMYARSRLSCHLAEMAAQVAKLHTQKNGAEFQRKADHSRILRSEMSVEKTSAAAAKIIADNETTEQMRREFEADSEYQAARVLYDAWRNVCDVMSQHISNLKSEKNAELRGQGQSV